MDSTLHRRAGRCGDAPMEACMRMARIAKSAHGGWRFALAGSALVLAAGVAAAPSSAAAARPAASSSCVGQKATGPFRINPGTGQHGLDHARGKLLDGHIPEAAAERADRRAHGRDDRCSADGGHDYSLSRPFCLPRLYEGMIRRSRSGPPDDAVGWPRSRGLPGSGALAGSCRIAHAASCQYRVLISKAWRTSR